ncbi:MAG: family 43 glycosylhydrolase [Clostridia bacterium]|nr:family 43 glycosylhydrolase [Clostridia bacterium]
MKFSDVHIRDPFVLPYDGKYYLYGTRGSTAWTKAEGLDVYVSTDLEDWTDAHECFAVPQNFWADKEIWAPEVHHYNGSFYMFVTFRSEERDRATQILKSDSPMGPFLPFTEDAITPIGWRCLDGTFYVDKKGVPYIIFCREWQQVKDGEIHAMKLKKDLTAADGEPILLFKASQPDWADKTRETFITDGPFMYRTKDDRLLMIWSTFTPKGYVQAVAYSDNGEINGNWLHESPMFEENGGHGMIFDDFNGNKYLILHSPNENPYERPILFPVVEIDGSIKLV